MTNENQIAIAGSVVLALITLYVGYHVWPKPVLTAQERCVQQYSRADNMFNGLVLPLCKHAKD